MSVKTIPATDYAEWLLCNRDHITAADIPMETDFDYVMSIMLAVDYDEGASPYKLTFGEGQIKKNGYSYPNMTISRHK